MSIASAPPSSGAESAAPKTVTRADLAGAVARAINCRKTDASKLVDLVLGEISDALVRGENVKFSGFGSFQRRSKGVRIGRNPRTGVEAVIEKRRVIAFKTSGLLKDRVNGVGKAAVAAPGTPPGQG